VRPEAARSESSSAAERKVLERKLEAAIRAALANPKVTSSSLVADAIEAVEQVAANRVIVVRRFLDNLLTRLEEKRPKSVASGTTAKDIEDAVMVTENIALEYARLAHVVATIGDQEVARVLYRGFGALLDQYDVPRGFSGTISTWDFDFIKFHGHEMFTILTACLIREGRWELIADLLAEAIPRNRSGSCFF